MRWRESIGSCTIWLLSRRGRLRWNNAVPTQSNSTTQSASNSSTLLSSVLVLDSGKMQKIIQRARRTNTLPALFLYPFSPSFPLFIFNSIWFGLVREPVVRLKSKRDKKPENPYKIRKIWKGKRKFGWVWFGSVRCGGEPKKGKRGGKVKRRMKGEGIRKRDGKRGKMKREMVLNWVNLGRGSCLVMLNLDGIMWRIWIGWEQRGSD